MGRPKIKAIETAIELDKVKLPETEEDLPVLDEKAEEILAQETKTKLAEKKKSAKSTVAKKPHQHSKRYLEALKLVDKSKGFSVSEAVAVIKQTASTKFDSSVEVHINLNTDPSKQEHQIRATASLPAGSGKKLTVLVFGAKDTKAAQESGALIGDEETLTEIEKGKINFQKVVASPDWMPKLAKVAKILGPKGLMPNPKSGTVSPEPEKVAAELGSGMIEIKTENSPIIHATVGKVSFKDKDLVENIEALVNAVRNHKPQDFKKDLIRNVYLTSTMGPSVKLDLSSFSQ